MPSSPYRSSAAPPSRAVEPSEPLDDSALLPVFALFWVSCLARVAQGVARGEAFGAETTAALLSLVMLPLLAKGGLRRRLHAKTLLHAALAREGRPPLPPPPQARPFLSWLRSEPGAPIITPPVALATEAIVTVLLADDHQIVREGLRAILEKEPGIVIVGEAADGRAACAAVAELRPAVVVMDISMPGLNGLEAAKQIIAEHPSVKVIALSMRADKRDAVAMLLAGASAYLVKMTAGEELVRAIRAVVAGHSYLSPEISDAVVNALRAQTLPSAPAAELSPREREVLQLIAEGKTSKEIAARLGVAVTTIESHRRQIMDKLNLRSIAELTKYAIREGITSVER